MAVDLRCQVRHDDAALGEWVQAAATSTGRPARAVHLQALLQLPRLADELGTVSTDDAGELVHALAGEQPAGAAWRVKGGDRVDRLRFHPVGENEATDVLTRFHYLRSPRVDGRGYGVSTSDGRLVALCLSSPLDVDRLAHLLADADRSPPSARVVSRVFAFEGAPYNTLSYLLAKACHAEAQLGVTDMVTYVNPNMGFRGASYRASGWHLLGHEPGTTYRYLDGRYITDRALHATFGRQDDGGYRRVLGARFAHSVMPLAPLLVFHRPIARPRSVSSGPPPGTRAYMSQPDPYPPIDTPPAPLPDPEPLPTPPTPQPPIPDPQPI